MTGPDASVAGGGAPVPGGDGGAPGTIALTGVRARGRHGVWQAERARGQEFVVDAVLELDLGPAAATDRLADTVDYGALAASLAEVVTGPPVHLLETLAARLVAVCLADPRVAAATVTVHKPEAPVAPEVADVAVTLRRARAGSGGTAG